MRKNYLSIRFAFLVCFLAWIVVMLGAYTRLKDAGLGCPDWPGCYGQITVPQTSEQIKLATKAYPNQPVEAAKAWPEMVHRYFVGALGISILVLAGISYRKRRKNQVIFTLSLLAIGVVIFQALLGKWTVTMRLLPLVVMGHLLGGFTLLALLWMIFLRLGEYRQRLNSADTSLQSWGLIALGLIILQIMLGGWTSANYAALICPDFPFCQGQLIPPLDLKSAFNVFMPIGENFQGGILQKPARVTIQFMHRLGALITFLYTGWFSFRCMLAKTPMIRYLGIGLLVVLLLQIMLGILNVELMLPIFIAVLHNGVAATLLLWIVTILHYLYTGANMGKITAYKKSV